MTIRQHIQCTNTIDIIHRWEDAPADEAFMKSFHRHVLTIKSARRVRDRVEPVPALTMQRKIHIHLQAKYAGETIELSCLDIANELLDAFDLSKCEIMEDGGCGAVVERL